MELGVVRVELDRVPEGGHPERQTIVRQVADGIVVAILGLELAHLLVLRGAAARARRQHERSEQQRDERVAPP